jgi:hypothetical protein
MVDSEMLIIHHHADLMFEHSPFSPIHRLMGPTYASGAQKSRDKIKPII